LHYGCWCCGMWWQCHGTQHSQDEAMAAIERILIGYLEGPAAAELAGRFPDVEGFVHRVCSWLPPISELSQIQRLMIERMLLPFTYLSRRNADYAAVHHDGFGESGRGSQLDREILHVYAYLGPTRPHVKEWLSACLWKSLCRAGNPRGLLIQNELSDQIMELGVSSRQWIGQQLGGSKP
jgi:hypothetical protein